MMLIGGKVGADGVRDSDLCPCCCVTQQIVPHFLSVFFFPVTVAVLAPRTFAVNSNFMFVDFDLVLDRCRRLRRPVPVLHVFGVFFVACSNICRDALVQNLHQLLQTSQLDVDVGAPQGSLDGVPHHVYGVQLWVGNRGTRIVMPNRLARSCT